MIANLRQTILVTLSYFDIFNYPLTATQVHRYIINPTRLDPRVSGVDEISLASIISGLDTLVQAGKIGQRYGMYTANPERLPLIEERLAREKISAPKWKKLLRKARWFQLVPYVSAFFVSGSLAMENTEEDADFDALIVVRKGHLYVTRLLVSLVASLMGARRTRYAFSAPDKFCFNHWLTDDALLLQNQSIYTAYAYATLVPIVDYTDATVRFFRANSWINQFAYNFTPPHLSISRMVRPSRWMRLCARFGEMILDTHIGDWLESLARIHQQRRIRNNPATAASGGRTIYTDQHLEFHPRSFEAIVIQRYNGALKKMGVSPQIQEQDSGLTN